jgi:hypothetical protein
VKRHEIFNFWHCNCVAGGGFFMITLEQYFAKKPHTKEHSANAFDLLGKVNELLTDANSDGFKRTIDPDTLSEISGSKGGSGDGGFRLSNATTGRPMSSHKEAKGVDVYDPLNALDNWLSKFEDGKGNNAMLSKYGLYREHPYATPTWCHLSTRAPKSGRRTFYP